MRPVRSLADLAVEASGCTRCALAAGRTQVVFGVGDPHANLVFIGEGPGREEDLKGEPFVGRSGKLLDTLLRQEIGLERAQCYIANVVKCRPPGNRDPQPDEIAACRPYLEEQLTVIAPKVVVTLGNFAARFLLETTEGIRKLRGQVYSMKSFQVVPTYHPAAALRGGAGILAEMRADFVRAKLLLPVAPPARPL
jgi:DNA polymerase